MFACIFIPDFIVEAVLRAEPMLRGQAVAVLEGKPPLCYVVGANEVARNLGVEIGMTKLLAETLQATEEPKIGGTGEQQRNRRSGETKNEKLKSEKLNDKTDKGSFDFGRASLGASSAQDDTGKNEGRETNNGERGTKNTAEKVVRQRAHSAGAYEAAYGRMDTRFGLYRTKLDAEELRANDPAQERQEQLSELQERTENRGSRQPAGRRGEKIDRNGVGWSHDAIRQGSYVAPGKTWGEHAGSAGALKLRQRTTAQEESAHAALLDAAHAVSPKVEDTGPDTVILDVAGLERLFGTPQQIAQELMRRVMEVGLMGNVAIAANPDAAEHAARGFAGVTVLPANREAERLSTLPLEVLFAAERSAVMRSTQRKDEQRKASERFRRMQETLDRWGIRNFRGLATLPPVSLSERLGTSGVRLQKLAAGGAMRELVLTEPGLRFEETVELEYPVDVLEPLAFLIARMLDGLCGRLAARALSTNELRLRMKLEHRTGEEAAKSEEELEGEPIVERKIALPVPMNDARLFLKLLQLELSATPPGAPVTQLWLEAEPARPRVGQAGLFQPLAPEAQKLELTLARMHKLLAVRDQLRAGTAEVVDTHQPDSFRVQRFVPVEERATEKTKGPSTTDALRLARPSLRMTQDQPKDRRSGEPKNEQLTTENILSALSLRRFRPVFVAQVEVRDGAPVRLACAELGVRDPAHDNIVWAAGPWRTSGNWWESKRNRRTEDRGNRRTEAKPKERRSSEPENAQQNTKNEQSTENAERRTDEVCNWNSEEWDVALAMMTAVVSEQERRTQVGLYRLVHCRVTEQWTVEGGYD